MNFAVNIEKSCRLHPAKTCVIQEDIRLTFNQMEERANRLAKALVEMGLKPGDRVAIFQTNCFQFCEMLYAVGKVGGIFINLNFRFRGEEAAYILNNCTPKVLILGDRYTELIKDIRPNLPSIEHYIVIGEPPADLQGYEALLSRQSGDPFPLPFRSGGRYRLLNLHQWNNRTSQGGDDHPGQYQDPPDGPVHHRRGNLAAERSHVPHCRGSQHAAAPLSRVIPRLSCLSSTPGFSWISSKGRRWPRPIWFPPCSRASWITRTFRRKTSAL